MKHYVAMAKSHTAMPESLLLGSKSAGALIALLIACVIALISTGQLQVPLPAPAHGKVVNEVPEDVMPWKPQPLQGVFASNTRLYDAVRLFEGKVVGAESVAVTSTGDLALLDRQGNLYEAALTKSSSPAGSSSSSNDGSSSSSWVLNERPVAKLGAGRPLGYHFDHNGDLIVCDSLKGLVKYDYTSKEVVILATHVSQDSQIDPGSEITYANDLAIASDGRIYFTSCTDIVPAMNRAGFYDTFKAWMLDLAQGLPKGRLLQYDPATKETIVLAKGFYYANGVALSDDESYIVLAETDRIRLVRYWLRGPKAGTSEPLVERLPGPPDGVTTAPDGNFWVALINPVPPIARLLRDPTVRAVYAWLPNWARPPVKKWGAVVKVSGETGAVLDWLMDPTGKHVSSVSAALEHDGKLFLGNLAGDYVSYVDLTAATRQGATPRSINGVKSSETSDRRRPAFVAFADAAATQEEDSDLCSAGSTHGACANGGVHGVRNADDDGDDVAAVVGGSEGSRGAMSIEDRTMLYINGKVSNNKVVVFSKSYCPYCRKAKRALSKFLQPEQYVVVELDQLHALPEHDEGRTIPEDVLQDALERLTGRRTVPRVFIGSKCVGGGDDIDSMAQTGRLKSILEEQGFEIREQ